MNLAYHVIGLDPEGDRYRRFAEHNRHLGPVDIFKGIRGADIPMADRVPKGLLTPELLAAGTVTEGTLRCAASHRALWRRIAASSGGGLIMEDDVLTHPDLPAYLAANVDQLRSRDITFLTVNTDSVLATVSPQGLVTSAIFEPRNPDPAWIRNAFAATDIRDVRRPHRMLKGFGLCCYWLSPQGAARLLDTCFPLTLEGTDIPFMTKKWPGTAIDGRMNAFYPVMQAYVTRPFLAYSPNDDSATSV